MLRGWTTTSPQKKFDFLFFYYHLRCVLSHSLFGDVKISYLIHVHSKFIFQLLDYSDDEEEVIARRKFEEEKGEESHSIRNMEKSIGLSKSRKKEKRNFKKEKPRHKKTWMGNSFGNKRQGLSNLVCISQTPFEIKRWWFLYSFVQ